MGVTSTRIHEVRMVEGDSWHTVQLICDRPFEVSPKRLIIHPRLSDLGEILAGTAVGHAMLNLIRGVTTKNIRLEDTHVEHEARGCITITTNGADVTLADLLDDLLRLAGEQESRVDPQDIPAVLEEIKRACNLYLALLEQGDIPHPEVTCKSIMPGKKAVLWIHFAEPLSEFGDITLRPRNLVRYFRRIMPWMAFLLNYLAAQEVIVAGAILKPARLGLLSPPVSPECPTLLDSIERMVVAAETYGDYMPTQEAIARVLREGRWHQAANRIDHLDILRARMTLVLRELARPAKQA